MSENVPEYIAVSSFASRFEGDAETAGQLMDVLLRKHYMALSFEEIGDIFSHKESEEVRDTLELFVEKDLVDETSEGYRVNKDSQIVQNLRDEQTEML